jgi:hypothetical protein
MFDDLLSHRNWIILLVNSFLLTETPLKLGENTPDLTQIKL